MKHKLKSFKKKHLQDPAYPFSGNLLDSIQKVLNDVSVARQQMGSSLQLIEKSDEDPLLSETNSLSILSTSIETKVKNQISTSRQIFQSLGGVKTKHDITLSKINKSILESIKEHSVESFLQTHDQIKQQFEKSAGGSDNELFTLTPLPLLTKLFEQFFSTHHTLDVFSFFILGKRIDGPLQTKSQTLQQSLQELFQKTFGDVQPHRKVCLKHFFESDVLLPCTLR